MKRVLLALGSVLLILLTAFLIYAYKTPKPVLFYYGGGVEVPDGTAIPVFNPFRDRAHEKTARRLITDLQSARCEEVVRSFREDENRICSAIRGTKKSRLVWREDGPTVHLLVYEFPQTRSRLWITFDQGDESGWGVRHISLIR